MATRKRKKHNWEHFSDPDWTGSTSSTVVTTLPIDIPQPPGRPKTVMTRHRTISHISPLDVSGYQFPYSILAECLITESSLAKGFISGKSYDGATPPTTYRKPRESNSLIHSLR